MENDNDRIKMPKCVLDDIELAKEWGKTLLDFGRDVAQHEFNLFPDTRDWIYTDEQVDYSKSKKDLIVLAWTQPEQVESDVEIYIIMIGDSLYVGDIHTIGKNINQCVLTANRGKAMTFDNIFAEIVRKQLNGTLIPV